MSIGGVTNQGLELVPFGALEDQRKENNLHGDQYMHTRTQAHAHTA